MLLREFLPARSAEDIWSEIIRVRLGGTEYALPMLSMDENAEWKDLVRKEAAQAFGALEGLDSIDSILVLLSTIETVTLVRLLKAYDHDGVLPDEPAIRSTCSEQSVLRAFLEVFSAANPTLAVTVDLLVRNPEMIRVLVSELAPRRAPSSGSQPSTDGPRDTSDAT